MQMLNEDFDLNTFYWLYVRIDDHEGRYVVTYTAACYDTSKRTLEGTGDSDTPFLIIETKPLLDTTFWSEPEQFEYTVDSRVVEALKKHFNHKFMLEDGQLMMAEYVLGASGELHKHPEFGQAIFGMDLEEAYADE